MAVSKVILNGTTLMDVTQKTVTSATMLDGYTALKNDGTSITGEYVAPSPSFTNIISNNDFSDGTTGWATLQPSHSSISVSGGRLVLTHTTTSNRGYGVSCSVNTQAGHTYLIEYKLTKTIVDTDADARGIYVKFGGLNGEVVGMINGITQDQTITQMVAGTASSAQTTISITFLGNISTAASNDSMMEIWYCNMYDITNYLP